MWSATFFVTTFQNSQCLKLFFQMILSYFLFYEHFTTKMFHFKQWLVLLPRYLRALDFTGFYIFFSQHLDSFFCNLAIRNWVKSKNETNHLDARDKKQFAINPTWKICKLHPWWSLSLWRSRPRIHFTALGDKSVRCANAPPVPRWHQLTNPTDIQHSKWLHSCRPQVTVPEALGWVLQQKTQGDPHQWPEISWTPMSWGDLPQRPRDLALFQRVETSVTNRDPASPKYSGDHPPVNDQGRFCPSKPREIFSSQ